MESFSVSTVVEILSSPAPPNSSGTPPPIKPTSPPFFTSSAISPGFLFSSSFTTGKTSFTTNSSAVCPINFWSSVRSAGVNTSLGCGDSRRKLPPFAAGLVRAAVAIWSVLAGSHFNWILVNDCLWHATKSVRPILLPLDGPVNTVNSLVSEEFQRLPVRVRSASSERSDSGYNPRSFHASLRTLMNTLHSFPPLPFLPLILGALLLAERSAPQVPPAS